MSNMKKELGVSRDKGIKIVEGACARSACLFVVKRVATVLRQM